MCCLYNLSNKNIKNMIILLSLLAILWFVSKIFAPSQAKYIEQTMHRTLKGRKVIFWKIVLPGIKLTIGSYLTWYLYLLIHYSGMFSIDFTGKIPESSQHLVYGAIQILICFIPLVVVFVYLVKSIKGAIKTFRLISEVKHNLESEEYFKEEDFFT
jgi:hypothetical protein